MRCWARHADRTLLLPLLLLLCVGLCVLSLAPVDGALGKKVSTINSTCTEPPGKGHDNVRCTCSCTLPTQVPEALSKCETSELDYTTNGRDDVCGRETCLKCPKSEHTRVNEQCNYAVIVSSRDDCTCKNILPRSTDANVSQATTADCGLCSCTYELRDQTLVKVGIVTFLAACAIMLVASIFMTPPATETRAHNHPLGMD